MDYSSSFGLLDIMVLILKLVRDLAGTLGLGLGLTPLDLELGLASQGGQGQVKGAKRETE